ncbi:MAG: hypothetical protein KDC05_06650 [Bacteroidales bacterium]|nr:hypothetical protein [Bacteroidales bacterium]
MKTLILTAVLAVFTITAFAQEENSAKSNDFVMASDDINIALYPGNSDAVTMILVKNNGQNVKIRVSDADNQVLYSKWFRKVNRAKVKYDISQFPAGAYTFDVIEGNKVLYSKTFSKRANTVAMAD